MKPGACCHEARLHRPLPRLCSGLPCPLAARHTVIFSSRWASPFPGHVLLELPLQEGSLAGDAPSPRRPLRPPEASGVGLTGLGSLPGKCANAASPGSTCFQISVRSCFSGPSAATVILNVHLRKGGGGQFQAWGRHKDPFLGSWSPALSLPFVARTLTPHLPPSPWKRRRAFLAGLLQLADVSVTTK